MIKIKDKAFCAGCTACACSCPQKCIRMIPDLEGFVYPAVDEKKCIDCRICEKVCPINKGVKQEFETYTVCAQNRDNFIRKISSAGGLMGAIYKVVIDNNGVVYGAGMGENNMVVHMKAQTMEECLEKKLFASKYVASNLENVFLDVESELNNGRLVCFAGLPCQVAGLKSFLKKKYDKLWLIDLTCYGVPSAKLYENYINFIEKEYKNKVVDVRFRDKTFGYAAPTMCIELESGKVISQNSNVKSYLRCFFSDIASRPSCYKCQFKSVERVSDITVGDCRSIRNFSTEFDDDLGTTVLYIHSSKGKHILKEISFMVRYVDVSLDGILKSSGKKMITCATANPQREKFYGDIDVLDYYHLVKKYCPAKLDERISSLLKWILKITGLYKTGVLRKLKQR